MVQGQQPKPLSQAQVNRMAEVISSIIMNAIFFTPMILVAAVINVNAIKFFGLESSFVSILMNVDYISGITFMAIVGVIGLYTNAWGWWNAPQRAGNAITRKLANSHKLRLYGLMTVMLTLLFGVIQLPFVIV